ncbi:MAG: RNA polymerase-binding protein DksA [Epsilonproteobacteria bacterium]|nr:RNA polymerase-binding protein DksA [Campylobacterota bacterium]
MEEKEYIYFKEELEGRKKKILKIVTDNEKEIKALSTTEANDEADYATISTDSAIEQAINNQQLTELKDIEYALFKIENKTYGICEMCEDPIGIQRLKVKPQAKYCIVCREIVEKTS